MHRTMSHCCRSRRNMLNRPRKRLGHPAHHKPTTHFRLEHSRPIPVHPVPIPPPLSVLQTTASPSPSLSEAHLPYDCPTNVDYALDCCGNYVRCANGIVYRMKCSQGLVFDQIRQYCDYPQHVAQDAVPAKLLPYCRSLNLIRIGRKNKSQSWLGLRCSRLYCRTLLIAQICARHPQTDSLERAAPPPL
ncbi:unnamed protein product [Cylicocyclus nassatus]|uniref:Chitin-binding type-2 domain-containing protein n=1 Tax=Cylicocyclus nassatus TaxID=53992 RepID=A0AA36HHK6_CYLNA|nr:unnamed protein product [Cylicocyclus nassatus]